MNASVLLLGVAVVLAVASAGASLFAIWRSRVMVLMADQRARDGVEACHKTVEALRRTVDGMASQLRDQPHQVSAVAIAGVPRQGLNLSRRSQVLRMHRKGDPPDRIAASLEVPMQEVELLIKVHRIVTQNL
jgi:hypothetical protein